jgi:hypothetical protein
MTCEYIPPTKKRLWLSDTYRQTGDEIKAAWIRKHGLDELMPQTYGLLICGSFKPSPRCDCGQIAEYLCDEPMGKGKTCDIPLCEACKTSIGDGLDLCPVHTSRQHLRATQAELPFDD